MTIRGEWWVYDIATFQHYRDYKWPLNGIDMGFNHKTYGIIVTYQHYRAMAMDMTMDDPQPCNCELSFGFQRLQPLAGRRAVVTDTACRPRHLELCGTGWNCCHLTENMKNDGLVGGIRIIYG